MSLKTETITAIRHTWTPNKPLSSQFLEDRDIQDLRGIPEVFVSKNVYAVLREEATAGLFRTGNWREALAMESQDGGLMIGGVYVREGLK